MKHYGIVSVVEELERQTELHFLFWIKPGSELLVALFFLFNVAVLFSVHKDCNISTTSGSWLHAS